MYAEKTTEIDLRSVKGWYLKGISQLMLSHDSENDWQSLIKEGIGNLKTAISMDESYNQRSLVDTLRGALQKAQKLQRIRGVEAKKSDIAELKAYMNKALASNSSLRSDVCRLIDEEMVVINFVDTAPSHLECSISLVGAGEPGVVQ